MATRFKYIDPICSVLIGIMILLTSVPLFWRTGRILLESAPVEIDLKGVEQDILRVEGVESIHELHASFALLTSIPS